MSLPLSGFCVLADLFGLGLLWLGCVASLLRCGGVPVSVEGFGCLAALAG
jgi:hypothetical protein